MKIETEDYIQIGTWAIQIGLNNKQLAYDYIKTYGIETIEIDGRKFLKKDTPNPREVKFNEDAYKTFRNKKDFLLRKTV